MKKTLLLALLVWSSLTVRAQSPDPLVHVSCAPSPASRPADKTAPVSAPPAATLSRPPVGPGPEPATCSGVINVNIHFMLRLDGTGNFNERNDGNSYKPWNANQASDPLIPADTATNGFARARALVAEMNNQAASNPMNIYPAGTANPPKGFSYALNGVYFHRVSNYDIVKSSADIYSTAPFDTYGVNKATEVNMFMMGNYTNGSCCDVGGLACTLGYNSSTPSSYWVKTFNTYELYTWRKANNGNTIPLSTGPYTIPQNSLPLTSNTLAHEIGHVLGLIHTFEGANGCADAASSSQGQSGNNQMDYTNASGSALTPCQLDVVNLNLYNPGNPANSYHNYLSTSYCGEVPPRANFTMLACLRPGDVGMDSRATFMADQVTIRVYAHDPMALTGHGPLLVTYTRPVSQGNIWNLASLYGFVAGQLYHVQLTASRTSGQSHTSEQLIQIYQQFEGPCEPQPYPIDPAARVAPPTGKPAELAVYPNPAQDVMTVRLSAGAATTTGGVIYDSYGREMQRFTLEKGQTTISVRALRPGIYYLRGTGTANGETTRFRIER